MATRNGCFVSEMSVSVTSVVLCFLDAPPRSLGWFGLPFTCLSWENKCAADPEAAGGTDKAAVLQRV